MPSVMQRVGTPNAHHNLDNNYRKHLDNVDAALSQYNEVIRHKSVEVIYAEHLQPAFEEFNERQKRKDRRLDVKWDCNDALGYQRALDRAAKESDNKKLRETGRPPIREIVWQFGNPEQGYGCAGQTDESRQQIKEMLLEVQEEAERRYPQFAWGDVVFHADEVSFDADDKEMGSMHLHSSFVPLCFQNKQGMSVQVAFERCLAEMGFKSFDDWKHDLDRIMEDVLERHGLERTVIGNYKEHQSSKEFHRQQLLIKQTKEIGKAADREEQRLFKATGSREILTMELKDLEEKKDVLEGYVEFLQSNRDELMAQNEELSRDAAEMERELPVLQAQISEARAELALVQRVIKDTLDNAANHTNWDSVREQIERAKAKAAKEKRAGELEAFRSQIVRFFERNPDVKERFLADAVAEQGREKNTRPKGLEIGD